MIIKVMQVVAGEMSWWLGTLASLSEDTGSVSNSYDFKISRYVCGARTGGKPSHIFKLKNKVSFKNNLTLVLQI